MILNFLKRRSSAWGFSWFPAGLFMVFSGGCDGNATWMMKEATGHPGEVVVVLPPAYVQEPNPVLDTLKAWFSRPMRVMLQPEAFYKVFRIDDAHFGSVFKYHRNVLLVNLDAPKGTPMLAMQDNKWARRQRVVQLNVQGENGFQSAFREKREEIEALFYQRDLERLMEDFEKNPASEAVAQVEKATGARLALPAGFFCVDTGQAKAYVRHIAERSLPGGHRGVIERGILIQSGPYDQASRFSVGSFLSDFAPVLRQKVHGAKDSTWMEVEPRVPCDSSAISLNGAYGLRLRGLWRMHGEFKGGPFVGLRYFDPIKKKLFSVWAYVYAPAFNKRTYMFQVEAIARSVGPRPQPD